MQCKNSWLQREAHRRGADWRIAHIVLCPIIDCRLVLSETGGQEYLLADEVSLQGERRTRRIPLCHLPVRFRRGWPFEGSHIERLEHHRIHDLPLLFVGIEAHHHPLPSTTLAGGGREALLPTGSALGFVSPVRICATRSGHCNALDSRVALCFSLLPFGILFLGESVECFFEALRELSLREQS